MIRRPDSTLLFFQLYRSIIFRIIIPLLLTPSIVLSLENWAPQQEPGIWQSVRKELTQSYALPDVSWIYLESLQSEKLEAAEYLSDLDRESNIAYFQGALILRRSPATAWTVRVHNMRALCDRGSLQRQNSAGVWTDYPGRPDTPRKVRWICAMAVRSLQ